MVHTSGDTKATCAVIVLEHKPTGFLSMDRAVALSDVLRNRRIELTYLKIVMSFSSCMPRLAISLP